MADSEETFDAPYFDRYYGSRSTRVHGKREVARLVRGVTELIAWFGGDVATVLDIGAGAGLWRDWFAGHKPTTKYISTDVSAYACARYGHVQRDIASWRARGTFDLVVCQGVLPYLKDDACARAIENIGAMSRGFLYVEAITARDLRQVCDREKTDGAVHRRTGAWYRARLDKYFTQVGCGLFYAKRGPLVFYELERI
jgi:hypothetical protein